VARLAEPRRLALTHLYPPVESVDIAGVISSKYNGPVVIAHDGWSTTIEE
jgi:ribonuclease BN (tRNA processing enzyme)